MTNKDKGWSEYWQQDGAGGEVFVNAAGGSHPALAEHWQAVFADLPAGTRVLDVASGAGSIYAHLREDHGLVLFAADVAPEALQTLEQRIPGTTTQVCGADDMPWEDGSFDLVVSQFGIEYAGRDAFSEAARLVAEGGRLIALAHIENGYIDSNNRAQLDEARLTRDCEFIQRAIELTDRAFSGNRNLLAEAEQAFLPLIRTMADAVGRCPRGIHAYLLAGFRQLYENRAAYHKQDIVGWLEQMNGELDKTLDRLGRMRAAALSETDVEAVSEALAARGFSAVTADAFVAEGKDKPLAWRLAATRLN